jgi:hypothetical protein
MGKEIYQTAGYTLLYDKQVEDVPSRSIRILSLYPSTNQLRSPPILLHGTARVR